MVAMVPESFLLFVGPLSCGRFSAMNMFGGEGKYGYLYITDADISLGKVYSEIVDAAAAVVDKYRPKAVITLLSCDVLIAGIDEEALLSELRAAHPGTAFQSFPVNHIAAGSGHGPVETMYVRMMEMLDRSGSADTVNFIGSGMFPACSSDVNKVLAELGLTGLHPVKMKTFEEFLAMGRSRFNVIVRPEGRDAAEAAGMPYCEMIPTYSFEEVREQYEGLFKLAGARCDLAPYEEEARASVARAAAALDGKTVSLGSTVTRRTFGLARLMLESGFDVRHIFITEELYAETSQADEADRKWVESAHPEVQVHMAGDTSMRSAVGRLCSADVSIGFNAAYMTDSPMVVNFTDDGQAGYGPMRLLMDRICESAEDPKDMRRTMAAYGVSI